MLADLFQLHPSLGPPEDMDSGTTLPCPTQVNYPKRIIFDKVETIFINEFDLQSQKWPFLRTQNNSPADEQGGSSALADPVSL